jgi:hypothetical protein
MGAPQFITHVVASPGILNRPTLHPLRQFLASNSCWISINPTDETKSPRRTLFADNMRRFRKLADTFLAEKPRDHQEERRALSRGRRSKRSKIDAASCDESWSRRVSESSQTRKLITIVLVLKVHMRRITERAPIELHCN